MVRSLSQRWLCYVCLVDRMKIASLEANLGGVRPLIYPILPFSLRSSNITEILLTRTLRIYLVNLSSRARGLINLYIHISIFFLNF